MNMWSLNELESSCSLSGIAEQNLEGEVSLRLLGIL